MVSHTINEAADRETFLASHATPDLVAFVLAAQPVTEDEIIRHTGATWIARPASADENVQDED